MKIIPFCNNQLKDIRNDDLVNSYIRKCDVSRAMNGIDEFPLIYKERYGIDSSSIHFIVQTYGCSKNCDYCYVTQDGIWKNPEVIDPLNLFAPITEVNDNQVFHLMGGSPAFWISEWKQVWKGIKKINKTAIFHSDFILNEFLYETLNPVFFDLSLLHDTLYAVSIKGDLTNLEIANLNYLIYKKLPIYITFTGEQKDFDKFCSEYPWIEDIYFIPIKWDFRALQK